MILQTATRFKPTVLTAAVLTVLTALMAAATPAHADVRIFGVDDGDAVREPVVLWAQSNSSRPQHITLRLTGPDGYERVRRVNGGDRKSVV